MKMEDVIEYTKFVEAGKNLLFFLTFVMDRVTILMGEKPDYITLKEG